MPLSLASSVVTVSGLNGRTTYVRGLYERCAYSASSGITEQALTTERCWIERCARTRSRHSDEKRVRFVNAYRESRQRERPGHSTCCRSGFSGAQRNAHPRPFNPIGSAAMRGLTRVRKNKKIYVCVGNLYICADYDIDELLYYTCM